MPISKIGVLVIVGILAAVAAAASYVASGDGGSLSDTLKHPTGLLTKVGFGDKEYATVDFSAEFTLASNPALQLSFDEPVESLDFHYNTLSQKIVLGDLSLSSAGESDLELKGYKGTVAVTDVLSFDGKTENFRYGTIFTNGPVNVHARGDAIKYTKLAMEGIPATSFSFPSVTGTISAKTSSEEFSAKINGELQLDDFKGSMTLENNKIVMKGVASIKTSLFQTQ